MHPWLLLCYLTRRSRFFSTSLQRILSVWRPLPPGDLASRSSQAVNLGLIEIRWITILIDAFIVGPCAKCRLSYKATTRARKIHRQQAHTICHSRHHCSVLILSFSPTKTTGKDVGKRPIRRVASCAINRFPWLRALQCHSSKKACTNAGGTLCPRGSLVSE